MTSTANGRNEFSYGWINYKLIGSGEKSEHINAYGGEERIWLGPEGGQFSVYFAKGLKQDETHLSLITEKIFGIKLTEVKEKFRL
jgi:hypothetical protein